MEAYQLPDHQAGEWNNMRDIGIGATYFLTLTAGMALIASGFAVVYPLGQWVWTWFGTGFDTVRAGVDMTYAARGAALSPRGMATAGAVFGASWAVWSAGHRWCKGYWPHQAQD